MTAWKSGWIVSMTDTNNKNIGGRPRETPTSLIEAELRSTIKTVRFGREMLATQLEQIAIQLANNSEITISARLEAVERLGAIVNALTKSVETLGKYSIGAANRNKSIDPEDDKVTTGPPSSSQIRSLLGGK